MKEVWKDIKGYEGKYQISNFGRVKALNYKRTGNEKILKIFGSTNGYSRICLCKNNIAKFYLLHRLVAKAFLTNSNNLPEVNHINGIKTDNNVENLEWCTRLENVKHSIDKKLRRNKYGKDNKTSKIIYQIDKETNKVINIFYGIGEIKRKTNFKNPTSISKCCRNVKNYKTAYGYIWKYAEGGDNDG